ncbi:MAG TPA: hypothetical protein VGX92_14820 [Pyrinomonadaceae bacterium]|jgi:hypothetical protein|nr:hypothetical protein [Pyrinomonadaceae bacterium]
MITYQKSLLEIGETWFDEETDAAPVDIICHRYSRQPIKDGISNAFYTITVDLQQDQDTLLANMKKGTRYEIRRACTTDNLIYKHWSTNCREVLPEFFEFYNKFAAQKGLLPANRARLELLARNNVLDISRISTDDHTLVWHGFFRGEKRVQLISSASLYRASKDSAYRNFIGRANRYHHWLDMLRFKKAEASHYGFGVWYTGTEKAKLTINDFKGEFGGELCQRFECKKALTIKGRLALRGVRILQAVRSDKPWLKFICLIALTQYVIVQPV